MIIIFPHSKTSCREVLLNYDAKSQLKCLNNKAKLLWKHLMEICIHTCCSLQRENNHKHQIRDYLIRMFAIVFPPLRQ